MEQTDPLMLVEGREAAALSISTGVTPQAYCALKYGSACTIQLTVSHADAAVDTELETKCYDGFTIPMYVVQYDGDSLTDAICGATLVQTMTSHSLKLKAVVDRKYRSASGDVKVQQQNFVGTTAKPPSNIATIKVCEIWCANDRVTFHCFLHCMVTE